MALTSRFGRNSDGCTACRDAVPAPTRPPCSLSTRVYSFCTRERMTCETALMRDTNWIWRAAEQMHRTLSLPALQRKRQSARARLGRLMANTADRLAVPLHQRRPPPARRRDAGRASRLRAPVAPAWKYAKHALWLPESHTLHFERLLVRHWSARSGGGRFEFERTPRAQACTDACDSETPSLPPPDM